MAKIKYGYFAIYHPIAKKYLCYNSFAEDHWYWGKKDSSEKFDIYDDIAINSPSIYFGPKRQSQMLLERFPGSILKAIYCNEADQTFSEERMRPMR